MEFKNEHLTRQLDIIPMEALSKSITVIGTGAVGSLLILALAKMGYTKIVAYDDDVVSVENMNSQFYRFSDIGKPKVEALMRLVHDFTGVEIVIHKGRYTGGKLTTDIVILAVDNMATRKLLWDQHAGQTVNVKFIIDPRMGAESALLYVMNPMDATDRESYSKSLYTDESAVHERCTEKATMYTACLLSGLVAKAVKDVTTTKAYLRTAQWNIKDNQLLCWNKEVA